MISTAYTGWPQKSKPLSLIIIHIYTSHYGDLVEDLCTKLGMGRVWAVSVGSGPLVNNTKIDFKI